MLEKWFENVKTCRNVQKSSLACWHVSVIYLVKSLGNHHHFLHEHHSLKKKKKPPNKHIFHFVFSYMLVSVAGGVTEVKTDIFVTSFGPVSDVEMVRLKFCNAKRRLDFIYQTPSTVTSDCLPCRHPAMSTSHELSSIWPALWCHYWWLLNQYDNT